MQKKACRYPALTNRIIMNKTPIIEEVYQAFERDVYCLFGLPVDNLTLAETKALLREKSKSLDSIVLSTINVNWVVQSFKDDDFRRAILNSDIVVLDGKPLLWLSKVLGYPLKEVVPGSTLIDQLLKDKRTAEPLKLFLFGGEDGVAQQALEQVNRSNGGLKVVGAINPGFGTIEEMSSNEIIESINAARPDILLVALGAKKGTQWIEHNRTRLNAKVISHLGATINFLAGTVARAPKYFQSVGMEWVWRIIQEPKLFMRYASDGLFICKLLIKRLPLLYHSSDFPLKFKKPVGAAVIGIEEDAASTKVELGSTIVQQNIMQLKEAVRNCTSQKAIIFDLTKTTYVDGSFWAFVLVVFRCQVKGGKRLSLAKINPKISRWFASYDMPRSMKVLQQIEIQQHLHFEQPQDSASLSEEFSRSNIYKSI